MTDIVNLLSSLQLEGRLAIAEDEGLKEEAAGPPPDLTQLPNTAVHAIFSSLDAVDKQNLFCTSKSVRELFAHHLCSISVRLPSDDEYIRGYGSLPNTLQGLPPTMHNMKFRIIRKFFNACHGSRLFASGELAPHSQLALTDFICSSSQPYKGGIANKLVANASQIDLQGYFLWSPVAALLATHCTACTDVRLSDVDLKGRFFGDLASMRCCSHLELTNVHLLDAEACSSLPCLSAMRNLSSLVISRVACVDVPPEHPVAAISAFQHPGFSFISQLSRLQHLKVQLAEGPAQAPSAAQFIAWVANCHQLSSLAVLGLEGLQYLSNTDLAPLVSGCASSLRRLQFDQHVVITGVQALLHMKQLEHVCARSLEPRPYACFANASPCSLRSLSLGGCCPSVSALAALPLHSLTRHLDITKLDLAPLSQANPATMADVLAAAVLNMARCPSLRIMGGKLELSGRPTPAGLPAPVQLHTIAAQPGNHGGLVSSIAPLLALEPLRTRGLTHLKLSGFALTPHHIQALVGAVGGGLTALTFSDCSFNAGTLQALLAHGGSLPHLLQVSFARHCVGADLRLLTEVLCSPDAAPLQVFLLYQLSFESTSDEGIVASDAGVGEAMQAIMAVHGLGRIQLHVRWSV